MNDFSEELKQLETLFPAGTEVTVAGETISVYPFKAGKLPQLFKLVNPISGLIQVTLQSESTDTIGKVLTILAHGGDNVLDLIALGLNKPRSFVDDLEQDEVVDALSTVLGVNISFFVQRVLPAAMKVADKVQTGQPS